MYTIPTGTDPHKHDLGLKELPKLTWEPHSALASWREQAACTPDNLPADDLDLYENDAWGEEGTGELYARAKEKCEKVCPVRGECLVDALQRPKTVSHKVQGMRAGYFFVGGGLLYADRKSLFDTYGIVTRKRDNT